MINTIWWNCSKGNWDSGLLCEIFDKHPSVFIQHNAHKAITVERAIVIVVGRPEVEPLRQYLETLKSGVVILTSEEDGFFDWKSAIPPHIEVWTQYWTPHGKEEIKERILLGAPNRIVDYKINTHLPKKYLWSFIGQMQNPHREKCVNVLSGLPDGYLKVVSGFGGYGEGGKEYQEYLDIMCQSKYVICPSGSMTAETFRLYESMACNAIPITDKRAPRDKEGFDYWAECCDFNTLISVNDWSELTVEMMQYPDLVKDSNLSNKPSHENYAQSHNEWWFEYKKELEQKLLNIANG